MKKIFLTGASSGIGLAIAQRLCAEGHEVWGTSRDRLRIPSLPGLHAVTLDLADTSLVRQSFQTALAEAGHFDVVINNAGSGHFDPVASISSEVISQQFQILVFAQIALCQLALAAMQDRGNGLIINVSSLAARLPVPFMGAYNAAKAALASFTMSLQLEVEGSDIRVIDLQPGDICTDFNNAVMKTSGVDARYRARVEQAWRVVDRNMKAAPKPELVARRIAKLMAAANPPPRSTVGDVFQSRIAPLIFRVLPQRVRVWGLKKYYGV